MLDLTVVAHQVQQRRLQQLLLRRHGRLQRRAELVAQLARKLVQPHAVELLHVQLRQALQVHHLVQQRQLDARGTAPELQQQSRHLADLRHRRLVDVEQRLGQVLSEVDPKRGDQLLEVVQPAGHGLLAIHVGDAHVTEERTPGQRIGQLQVVRVVVPGDLHAFELERRLVEQRAQPHCHPNAQPVLRALLEPDHGAAARGRVRQRSRAVDTHTRAGHHLVDLRQRRRTVPVPVQQQLVRGRIEQRDDVARPELLVAVVDAAVVEPARGLVQRSTQAHLGGRLLALRQLRPSLLPRASAAGDHHVLDRIGDQLPHLVHVLRLRQRVAEPGESFGRNRVVAKCQPLRAQAGAR